jgi:hypothetical protein
MPSLVPSVHQSSQSAISSLPLLPDNLVIQLYDLRFSDKGVSLMNKVTAWPRRDTVVTSINARDMYKGNKKDYSKY